MTDEAKPEEKPFEPVPEFEFARMTDDELREFVLGVCDQKIFTSQHLRSSDDLPMVFMVVGLGGLSNIPRAKLEQIGVLWEHMDKAGPRSVNGYPCFFSLRIMHIDDWKRAWRAIVVEQDRRAQIKV